MSIVRLSCCGRSWVGADRAHCCRRTAGCGHVFDDAVVWDFHRRSGACLDPATLGLDRTKNGIWMSPTSHS
ncbi:FDXHR family putative zinc-binding protein [Pseudonocardia nematodicida]|uniref:FDXHR family putative zinc-binding protein n=1 Tax=Pseudonocardia nematodicida TaxID=1206997 RepID=UPI003D7A146D